MPYSHLDRSVDLVDDRCGLIEVAYHFYDLVSSTSQFLTGTHEFSELVLAGRMSLFMDQNHSVAQFPLFRRPKRGGIWRGVAFIRARLGPFQQNWPEPVNLRLN